MRILYLLSIIYIGLALTSCASVEQPHNRQVYQTDTTPIKAPTCPYPKTNPLKVSFYTKGHPKLAYTVVGHESISKFNMGGNKRQEANIRDGMRELAAAMGGDAVIDIKHNDKAISGTVVAYEKSKEEVKA